MGGDRLLDHRAQISGRAGRGFGSHVRHPPVLLHGAAAVRGEPGPRPGGELVHPVDRAPLLGQPVVEHRGHQGPRLDPQLGADRGRERLELGGEHHSLAALPVVQRLDAERVPGQDQLAGPLVEQREREHAAEPGQRVRAPGPPGLQHDLGVGPGDEPGTAGGQFGPQQLEVVQLAVVDEGQAVLGQRLVSGGAEVDDRQPAVTELDCDPVVFVVPPPGCVRAAVRDPVGHDVHQLVAVGLLVAPSNSAHVSLRSAAGRRSRRRASGRTRPAPARPGPGPVYPSGSAGPRRPSGPQLPWRTPARRSA